MTASKTPSRPWRVSVLAAAFLLGFPAARAATVTATNTNDSGAGSLRAAVAAAGSGDTINFSVSGTIALTTGAISLSKNLTIDGTGQSVAVDGSNASGVFSVGSGATVFLRNLTISHGAATGTNGGAIVVGAGSTLTVDTCTLSASTTNGSGGALANFGTTTFTNATISGNFTSAGGGGAVYNAGTMTVSGTTVVNNSAPNDGGAFLNDSTGTLTIANSAFSGNSANANGGGGGALANVGAATITGSTFSGNSAVGYGGAIRADASGAPGFGKLDVVNSTFAGNVSNGSAGGGAIASVNAGAVRLFNVTVASNSATGTSFGGGLYVGGGTTLQSQNSILSGNAAPAGNGQDCIGTISSQGYNLVSNLEACTISGTTTGNVTGSAASLGALANNGGPTQTMVLNAGSPAIDAGNPAGCVDQNGAALTVDQRGFTRPSNGRCDMGAFEVQVAAPPASLSVSKSAPASVVSGQNLMYTLTYGNTGGTAATSVVLRDTVPSGTTFVSATGGGTLSAGDVVWNVATLGAGVTGQTVSFTVIVNAASGTVSNAAYSIVANGISSVAGSAVATSVQPAGGGGGAAAAVPALTPLALAGLSIALGAAGLAALRSRN